MVEDKDVVIATFSGSVALAGLALILLGFLISAYWSLRVGETDKKDAFQEATRMAFYTLVLAVFSVSASLAWLLEQHFVEVPIAMFSIALASVVTTGAEVISKLMDISADSLWRDVGRRLGRLTGPGSGP